MTLFSSRPALLAGAIAAAMFSSTAGAAERLYVFNWTDYMDPEIIEAFEKQYDVEVVQNYYGSLGEMYSKLQAGGVSQYDIVVPTNYFVPRMIEAGLLQPLDKSQLPNMSNLMSRFVNPPYDPDNQYSAPYLWGSTGLIINTKTFPEAAPSWSMVFDESANPDQPFSMLKDGQVMFGAACAFLGKPYNCTDQQDMVEAAKLMLKTKHRTNFTGFTDSTPVLGQVSRGVNTLGVTYNGDYLQYREDDPEGYANTEFVIPKEGSELWVDNMVIPARAPHPELAHKFINFILDAEVGAQLSNYTFYSTPNEAAVANLEEVLKQPPSLPSDEDMARLKFTPTLSGKDLQRYQQLWNEVQSR
ncbi:ABC transporter substrate-binding protein [Kushneria konosiri]|uniref:Putrescine-binding periplasmic protein n=1 Tax=Kushneria konosiri TaxID=698828 RepID=A0A2Z2HKS5_9GAMM|nr:spermidine/putrescine ABC transporter substrate-binding protein [Kushneria konosiri]ARS54291.1 ABC transporter substrate-binding protein [Kushneria konosiri]